MAAKKGIGHLLLRGFEKKPRTSLPRSKCRGSRVLSHSVTFPNFSERSRSPGAPPLFKQPIFKKSQSPFSFSKLIDSHKKKTRRRTIEKSSLSTDLKEVDLIKKGEIQDEPPVETIEPLHTSSLALITSTPVESISNPSELTTQPKSNLELAGISTLTTLDITRPQERLKESIEGFLLDQRSPHTRRAYGKDLKRFIQFLHVRKLHQGIETLNRTVLINYKEFLLHEKLEHTTVDRHLATLRSFFKWLVDDGILSRNPAEGVRFLNPKRLSTTVGFSDEEVKKVLNQPNLHSRVGSQHYAILMILFYCGLRRSEVCSLRTINIGTERNQTVLRLRGKGNSERILVMIPPVWNALKHYFHIARRDLESDEYLFIPMKNNRTKVLAKPLDPSMIFYIVRKYSKQAGTLNRVSPHSCRATAISNARDHDVPDRAIQEFAGWASPDMITRYDKRKTSIENSAAHSISYGSEDRPIPVTRQQDETGNSK